MRLPDTLDAWLAYVERLHHRPVDMGLERVRAVAGRLGLQGEPHKVARNIIVGGTNGKGSTCAMLDAILRAAGYRVGRYGSPHLLHFSERALINGAPATDAQLVPHFAEVEHARGAITLTYFEFTTLVVLAWFAAERVDVAILEVGLGGRLDAVNIVDADCAIVTTIDLDHVDLLGPTREQIGWEKAHIFRAGRPAICVEPDPPASLIDYAQAVGADLWRFGHEFSLSLPAPELRQWNYHGRRAKRMALPWPALRGAHQLRNAAGVLAALEALAGTLPVDQGAVRKGLGTVQLPGRFQVVPGRPTIVLDVAHNPQAAQALADALRSQAALPATDEAGGPGGPSGQMSAAARGPMPATHAIFGMLRDKDAAAVVAALRGVVDHWHLVPTAGERGRSAQALEAAVSGALCVTQVPGMAGPTAGNPVPESAQASVPAAAPSAHVPHTVHDSVAAALEQLRATVAPDDRIVVFGSFVIVAEALRCLELGSQ
jgi:dihydrofolate synthase/folylpolyglutamate synthase